MTATTRWLVYGTPKEFLAAAKAVVRAEVADGVEWEPRMGPLLARAVELGGRGGVNVVMHLHGDASDPLFATETARLCKGACVIVSTSAELSAQVADVCTVVGRDGLERVIDQVMAQVTGHGCSGDTEGDWSWDLVPDDVIDAMALGLERDEEQAGLALAEEERPHGAHYGPTVQGVESPKPWAHRATGGLPRSVVGGCEVPDGLGSLDREQSQRRDETECRSDSPCDNVECAGVVLGRVEPHVVVPKVEVVSAIEQPGGPRTPVVCFSSARGGVGKSALATLCALVLARDGLRVALIDLDYQFGTCLGYLGASETDGLLDAGEIPDSVRLDEHALARCRASCEQGLVGFEFCQLPEQAEVLSGMTRELVRAASSGFDVALVDLPCGLNEAVAQAFEVADRCLLVGDRRAFALESLKSQQSLCARIGVPRTKLVTVLNRCDARHRDEGFMSRAAFELQTPHIARVVEGGPEVMQLLTIGGASELVTVRNRFALSAADLIHAVCSDLGCLPESGRMPGAMAAPMSLPERAHVRRQKQNTRLGRRRSQKRREIACR